MCVHKPKPVDLTDAGMCLTTKLEFKSHCEGCASKTGLCHQCELSANGSARIASCICASQRSLFLAQPRLLIKKEEIITVFWFSHKTHTHTRTHTHIFSHRSKLPNKSTTIISNHVPSDCTTILLSSIEARSGSTTVPRQPLDSCCRRGC